MATKPGDPWERGDRWDDPWGDPRDGMIDGAGALLRYVAARAVTLWTQSTVCVRALMHMQAHHPPATWPLSPFLPPSFPFFPPSRLPHMALAFAERWPW